MNTRTEADKKLIGLVEPNEVLTDYLNALLGEVETREALEPATEVVTETIAEPLLPEPEIAEAEHHIPEQLEVNSGTDGQLATRVEAPSAKADFQILLFHVAGITLAVPLDKLDGILEWNEEVTPMPNRSPWFLGLLPERGNQIKIIDTAMLVVPEKFRVNHRREDMQKIILIGDGQWGLACDGVSEVVTLSHDQVRWRGEGGTRPWLAGTVVEQMCALLDIEQFVELLSSEKLEPAS
ncbi:chemotaxis protein CheW [Sulfuriflexus mobilis]|uniref:chemotaxis protein CheW n=1 Tax=Sulfuriflexus mobilis TaxID=1811807 RepID=UPI000F83B9B3|nr:chemotaxis protein CheW [Sulfuriflexus mobilis]